MPPPGLSTSKRCRTRILRGWQGRRSARVDMTKRRLKSAVTSTTGPAFTPSVFYAKFEVEIGALFDEIAYLVEKTSDLTLPESRRRPLDSVATSLSRSAARFKRAGRTAAAFHSWDDLYRFLLISLGARCALRCESRVLFVCLQEADKEFAADLGSERNVRPRTRGPPA